MGKKGGKLSQALASHQAKRQDQAKTAAAEAARQSKLASIGKGKGKGKGKAERKDLAEKKVQSELKKVKPVETAVEGNRNSGSSLDKYRKRNEKGKEEEKGKEKQVKQGGNLEEIQAENEESASNSTSNSKVSAEASKNSSSSRQRNKSKSIQPFSPEDTILLIGEGNFSFTLSLISGQSSYTHPTHQILSTAYDSESECYAKYPDASSNVKQIRRLAGREDIVVFGVDAGELAKCRNVTGRKKGDKLDRIKLKRWSKVWFGFPHNGSGHKDQRRNVLSNQLLLLRFLVSVAPLLTSGELPSYATSKRPKKRSLEDMEGGSEEDADDEEGPAETEETDDERGERMGDSERINGNQGIENDEQDLELNKVIKQGLSTSQFSDPDSDLSKLSAQPKTQPSHPTFKPPRKRGSVLITLRNSSPYTLWDVPHLATRLSSLLPSISNSAPALPKGQTVPTFSEIERSFSFDGEISSNVYSEDLDGGSANSNANKRREDAKNYRLWRSFRFNPHDWKGYSHRRTTGWIEGVSTSNNEDILRGVESEDLVPGTRKRSRESEKVGGAKREKIPSGECRTWEFGLDLFGDEPVGGTGSKRNLNPNLNSSKKGGKRLKK